MFEHCPVVARRGSGNDVKVAKSKWCGQQRGAGASRP